MKRFLTLALMLAATAAHAQVTMSNDKPIEISSDTLDVDQATNIATFSGNVIAVQGEVNMRSDKMLVHYREADKTATAPAKDKAAPATAKTTPPTKVDAAPAKPVPDAATKGISRIDATGNVIFTNPTDTAKGDFAVYDVDKQTLDLTGVVTLMRDKNILKGTHMNYNLTTGRSVLTAGGSAVPGQQGNGRVHGLFVPASDKKPEPDKKKSQ